MKYFKVKIGYNTDDFISVEETELAMAMRAMITGRIGTFKEGTINGRNIMAITADYNKMEGYNRDYKLTGEDYERIGKKTLDEYRDFISETKLEVDKQLSGSKLLE